MPFCRAYILQAILVCCYSLGLCCSASFAAEPGRQGQVSINMQMAISEAQLRSQQNISVDFQINFEKSLHRACFYLAYNDPNFFFDPTQSFRSHKQRSLQNMPSDGEISIKDSAKLSFLTPYLVEYRSKQPFNRLDLDFSFRMPRWPDRLGNQFLFHQFYPQYLSKCPTAQMPSYNFKSKTDISIQAEVLSPQKWLLTTPAKKYSQYKYKSEIGDFSFNLTKNYRVQNESMGQIGVRYVFLSESFESLKAPLERAFLKMSEWLGPFPYERLIIAESEDLEKSRVPGVISLNMPKQALMNALQEKYLNWMVWQSAYFLCEQWVGVSIKPKDFDDFWFFKGTCGFVVTEALKDDPEAYDIFKGQNGEKPLFSLKKYQFYDLVAAIMAITESNTTLVDSSNTSIRNFYTQYHFSYIRHLLAMRYLNWLYPKRFKNLSLDFFQSKQASKTSPRDYLHFLRKQKLEENGYSAASLLELWWRHESWPDFSLLDYQELHKSSPLHSVDLKIGFHEDFVMPVQLAIHTKNGKIYQKKIYPKSNIESVKVPIEGRLKSIDIDPQRQAFDIDRFNNSSKFPSLLVFPGQARTIRDDAYSLLWYPYPSQLPGEGIALNFGLTGLRYTRSGFRGTLKYLSDSGEVGGDILFFTKLTRFNLDSSIRYVENFGQRFRGSRYIGLELSKKYDFDETRTFKLASELNILEDILKTQPRYGVVGLESSLTQTIGDHLALELGLAHEYSLSIQKDFSFARRNASIAITASDNGSLLQLRAFGGKIHKRGAVPETVLFRPQTLEEAKIRIRSPRLDGSEQIISGNLDIFLPAYIPLPSSLFLLSRKAKWRLFYDYAESIKPDTLMSAFGGGVKVPLGADIVGKKSLSMIDFSLLIVAQSRYGDRIYKQPGVLFDFAGKL